MERTLNIKQKHSKDYQPPTFLSSSAIESLFFLMLQTQKDYENSLHNFEKTSENKDKNPCKK